LLDKLTRMIRTVALEAQFLLDIMDRWIILGKLEGPLPTFGQRLGLPFKKLESKKLQQEILTFLKKYTVQTAAEIMYRNLNIENTRKAL